MKQIFLIISFVVLSTAILSLKSVANNVVCEIVGGAQYETIDAAIAAVPANTPTTIRLLQTIDRTTTLNINGSRKITLDMNGFNLNITVSTSTNGAALEVKQNSSLTTTGSGTFNASGFIYGIYAVEGAVVNITGNVSATLSRSASGIYAFESAGVPVSVTVNGDVSGYTGFIAASGAEIVVNGNITGGSAGFRVLNGGDVYVSGNVSSSGASENCISIYTGAVLVGGNVTATGDGSNGIYVSNNSTLTVLGSIFAIQHGISAYTSHVVITGNISTSLAESSYTVYAGNSTEMNIGGHVVGNGDVGVVAETSSKVTVTGNIQSLYCGIRVSQSGEVFAKSDVIADATVGVGVNAYSVGKTTIDGTIRAYKDLIFGELEGAPVTPSTKEGFLTYSDGGDYASYIWIKDPSTQETFIISNEEGLIDELIRSGLGEKNLYEILVILQPYLTGRIPDNFIANLANSSGDKEVFTKALSQFAGTGQCIGINANGTISIIPTSFRAYYDKKEFLFYSFARNNTGRVKLLCADDPEQAPAVTVQGGTVSDCIISAIMW